MRTLPILQDVNSDLQIKNPQLNVDVDRDKASALGVSAAQKFGSVGLTPEGTKAQRPSELGRLHALHPSVQAESQQTPSAQ